MLLHFAIIEIWPLWQAVEPVTSGLVVKQRSLLGYQSGSPNLQQHESHGRMNVFTRPCLFIS